MVFSFPVSPTLLCTCHKLIKVLSIELAEQTLSLSFLGRQLSVCISPNELTVRQLCEGLGVLPFIKHIDTVTVEFPAFTNYLYSTYNAVKHDINFEDRGIIVLSSSAHRISSSVEFNFCAIRAIRTLCEQGLPRQSGAAMNLIYTCGNLSNYLQRAAEVSCKYPVVITKYVKLSKEIKTDAVAKDGKMIMHYISDRCLTYPCASLRSTFNSPPVFFVFSKAPPVPISVEFGDTEPKSTPALESPVDRVMFVEAASSSDDLWVHFAPQPAPPSSTIIDLLILAGNHGVTCQAVRPCRLRMSMEEEAACQVAAIPPPPPTAVAAALPTTTGSDSALALVLFSKFQVLSVPYLAIASVAPTPQPPAVALVLPTPEFQPTPGGKDTTGVSSSEFLC
ncbi:hypothetical protein EI94DRAFT_1701505 [Lactarius quietus]|nr:hypothetical protein EI94DRAFT_1701505 [Lactarius quietus]